MIKNIEQWIQQKQRANWGLPWHVFFACILFILVFPVFQIWWNFDRGAFWPHIMTTIIVNVIGYLNEILNPDRDKSEFWEDTAANNVGVLIGSALWMYILFVVRAGLI